MRPPKPQPKAKRLKIKRMTVCLAALAANSKAIICVADRALTYGDTIQWDADTGKIFTPNGLLIMVSDRGNGYRVITKLFEGTAETDARTRADVIAICEKQYRAAVDDLVEATFLRPRLLNKVNYIAAITAPNTNHLLQSIAKEINAFNIGCDLLVCGFDESRLPFILDIQSPGIANDMIPTGFQAIGSGFEKACARLLFAEHKRTHSIERVLYDCFDAKAFAEMTPGVGYEWDAVVMTEGKAYDVPLDIKEIIEQVWSKYNRSPFEKYDPKEHMKPPPRKWDQILREFADSLITSTSQRSTAQPKELP